MWENIVEPDRPQMKIWRVRIACWITKATDIHSEYVILIAFPLNNSCMHTPRCYVILTLTVLYKCGLEYLRRYSDSLRDGWSGVSNPGGDEIFRTRPD
jgi:hypothetical protein